MEIIVSLMEQLDLNAIRIFVKVIEYGSFTKAAQTLGMPKSRVSRQISLIERQLSTQLMYRTTRNIQLTAQGEVFFKRCQETMLNFEGAVNSISSSKNGGKHTIRLTAPLDLGLMLINRLVIQYKNLNPQVSFDLNYTDEIVDIVREGFDVAFRISQMRDSQLKTRKLTSIDFHLYASPQFVASRGQPDHPSDLSNFDCLYFSRFGKKRTWKFTNGKNLVAIRVPAGINTNHIESLRELAINGIGIAYLPDFAVASAVKNGQLIPIIKQWAGVKTAAFWVTPSHKEAAPHIQQFRDFIFRNVPAEI